MVKAKAQVLYTLAALTYVIPAVFILAGLAMRGMSGSMPGTLGLVFIFLIIPVVLFSIFFSFWVELALYWALINSLGVKEAMEQSLHKLGGFFKIAFLTLIIVLAGLVLFIIPGIIFSFWYSFAVLVFLCEGLTGMEALRKSKSYVKGRLGAIFWRLIYIVLIFIVLSIIGMPLPDPFEDIYNVVVSFLITPIFCAYHYLLYKNLVAISQPVELTPQPIEPV